MAGIWNEIRPLIVNLRRGIAPQVAWKSFRTLIDKEIDCICEELSTRRLVSLCDTFADYGDPVESRNAFFITLLVNLEKTSQTYLLWRLNYTDAFEVPPEHESKKVRLWDGMTSFHVEIGDVTNSFFARLDRLMAPTPSINQIYRTVIARMKDQQTILGTLNKTHKHVFDTDTRWRKDPAYDRFRQTGEIPEWKKDD